MNIDRLSNNFGLNSVFYPIEKSVMIHAPFMYRPVYYSEIIKEVLLFCYEKLNHNNTMFTVTRKSVVMGKKQPDIRVFPFIAHHHVRRSRSRTSSFPLFARIPLPTRPLRP